MKMLRRIGWLGLALVATSSAPALATVITFTGSGTGADGAALSAQATFDFSGNTLTVTLSNISTGDDTNSGKDVPANQLTGVFFDLTGNPTLTPVSATIAAGSIVQGSTCDAGTCDGSTTNVGGEFSYGTGAFPGGADRGMASAGFGLFGGPNFGGSNLDDPNAVDGMNFSIISLDEAFFPNGGLDGEPLIKNQVVFVLTGVSGLSIGDISDVSFQYGTALTEPNITGFCTSCTQAPEPATLVLLGCGLAALGFYRRRIDG